MTAFRSRALVVRTAKSGESDARITLWTESHGLVDVTAKGGAASRRRFGGCLQMLVECEASITARGQRWLLDDAFMLREWTTLAHNMATFVHASYVLELIGTLAPRQVPEPGLLDDVCAVWDVMQAAGALPNVLRWFELRLLGRLGLAPELTRCARCGDAVGPGSVFASGLGGAVCVNCRAPGLAMSATSLAALTTLQTRDVVAAARAPAAGDDARLALADFIALHVQRALRVPAFREQTARFGKR